MTTSGCSNCYRKQTNKQKWEAAKKPKYKCDLNFSWARLHEIALVSSLAGSATNKSKSLLLCTKSVH